jgi:hypothetical protein
MVLYINDETKRKATKCPSKFYCLNDEHNLLCSVNKPMCAAVRRIEGIGLFVKPVTKRGCFYRISFGCGFICNCPVRNKIFEKYKR